MSSGPEIFYKEIFCPDFDSLFYDEGCLIFENSLNQTLALTKLLDLCHNCDPQFWTNVPPRSQLFLLVPVYTDMSIQYYDADTQNGTHSCVQKFKFQQHGVYKYIADFCCDSIRVVKPPDYPYTSFLVFLVLALTLWVFYMILSHLNVKKRFLHIVERRFKWKGHGDQEMHKLETPRLSEPDVFKRVVYNEQTDTEQVLEFVSRGMNTVGSQEEIESLPVVVSTPLEFVEFEALLAFRGLVVTLFVYMSSETNTYYFLRQSPWHGLKLNDIHLGWLYWVLAASIYLHLNYNFIQGQSRKRLLLRGVLLRAVLYIALGCFYNYMNYTSPSRSKPKLSIKEFRVFGIFQRVALAHLITSSVEVFLIKRQLKRGAFFQDLRDSWPQWLVMLCLVALHTCVTFLLPVPGCPTGYQGPGGRSGHFKCLGGAANQVDRFIFNRKQLMHTSYLKETQSVYENTYRFDPQGILGTLTTCFLMALAMQASRIFIYFNHPLSRVIRLVAWAICQLLLGAFLCNFEKHGGFIPINQYLMSLSYVLVVSGLAYLVLLSCYLFISIWHLWSGFPLIYTGVNILVVYVGSELLKGMLPFRWLITDTYMHTHSAFLFRAAFTVCVWTYASYYLLKQRLVCPV